MIIMSNSFYRLLNMIPTYLAYASYTSICHVTTIAEQNYLPQWGKLQLFKYSSFSTSFFSNSLLYVFFSPSSLTCKRPIPRTMRVVLGQCLYTGKNGRFQCPCKAGTASLSFDTCCGPFCDTCTRRMGDHDESTEHHPYCKAGLRQPHLQCLEDVGIFFSNTPRLFGYIRGHPFSRGNA